jgi:hypothetical protein
MIVGSDRLLVSFGGNRDNEGLVMSRLLRVVSRCASGGVRGHGRLCDHPRMNLAGEEIGGRRADHDITVG